MTFSDLARLDAERLETFADRMQNRAAAFLGGGLVEAGIDDEGAVRAFDGPDVIGDRRHLVVRIAEDVVLRTLAPVAGVSQCEHLVDVVAHFLSPDDDAGALLNRLNDGGEILVRAHLTRGAFP